MSAAVASTRRRYQWGTLCFMLLFFISLYALLRELKIEKANLFTRRNKERKPLMIRRNRERLHNRFYSIKRTGSLGEIEKENF